MTPRPPGEPVTVLPDTSVWIEFLRATDSPGDAFLQRSLGEVSLAWTGPVLGELLCGATSRSADGVRRMVTDQRHAAIDPVEDFVWAADAYRRVRRDGLTVRSFVDCLVAAVCARHDLVLAHRDADFESLAAVTDLATLDLRG